jgi:exodeoxyribonuclease-3
MRLATWNVNSLRARLPRVETWIEENSPDVLCMQETKLADEDFPHLVFHALGYETATWGTGRWSGVAIVSRLGLSDVLRGFGEEPRLISALCGDVRVASVYVPNGRMVGSEHYVAKLQWMSELAGWLDARDPGVPVAVCGDFNVAPEDRDVWDPSELVGATHVSEPERSAHAALLERGLVDAFRLHHDEGGVFSWWDYRAGNFHKGIGMRIDLVLVSKELAERCVDARIDRNARKGKLPSDHAPVIIELADDADGA